MTSFDMNKGKIELLIEEKIKKNFPNSNFLIENISTKHKKHKQNITGEETHFIISVESNKFSKLSKKSDPLWSSIIFCTIANPNPVPSCLVVT